jgi:hypothetical protein
VLSPLLKGFVKGDEASVLVQVAQWRKIVYKQGRKRTLMTSSVTFLCSGKETEFHIDPEMTLELMMAANYLHT